MPKLRKWYFATNENGIRRPGARGLLRAAIRSCRLNTNLQPHLIYNGGPHPVLDEFRRFGVKIIPHTPSIDDALRVGYEDDYPTFVGHWLRFDVPTLETEDDFVLYTDIDVVFQRLPEALTAPRTLAVSPQLERDQREKFNSGVMIMNLPALREVWPDFRQAVLDRLLGNFVYPGHDEISFNAFFRPTIDWLPDEMNWRPYWGYNPTVSIIHFHGPKPGLCRTFESVTETPPQKQMFELWQRDRLAYDRYLAIYDEMVGDGVLATRPVRDTHITV